MDIPIKNEEGREVKVGIPIMKINIFQRFKDHHMSIWL